MQRIGFSGSCGPPHRVNQGNPLAPSGARTASNLRRAAEGFEVTPASGALMRRSATLSPRKIPLQEVPGNARMTQVARAPQLPPFDRTRGSSIRYRALRHQPHRAFRQQTTRSVRSSPACLGCRIRSRRRPDHSSRAISIRCAVTPHRLRAPRARSRRQRPPSSRRSSRNRRDSGWRRRTDRPRAGRPAPRGARPVHGSHPAQARDPQ